MPPKETPAEGRPFLGRPGGEGRPLGEALEAYLRVQGHGKVMALARISAAWVEVVGPEVAAHASPLQLRDGTLVVLVDQAAWGTQLGFLAEQILARLAEIAGPGLVRGIEATLRRS